MPKKHPLALIATVFCLLVAVPDAANAQCAVPYTLTNGQTADATQVMANVNALLACVNTISPGGSTNTVQYNAGGGSFGGVGPLTNGQVVIGSTGAAPQAAALTAGPGIAITNGAGSVTIGTTGSGSGLYSQVLSPTPTGTGTGLTNWFNQGSATETDSAVGMLITAPSSGGSGNVTGLYMGAPSTPYTITALIARTANSNSYNGAGIGWYDGTNKLHVLSYLTSNGNAPYLEVEKWNTATSFNSNDVASNPNSFSQPIWLQMRDDGTNVSFAFSQDGANFLQLFSVAKSSGFLGTTGYSQVIFFTNPQGSNTLSTLLSWKQS